MPIHRTVVSLCVLLALATGRSVLAQDDAGAVERELARRLAESGAVPEAGAPIAAVALEGEVAGAGAAFYVQGVAGLPERAVIQVTLVYRDRPVAGRRVAVEAGTFRCLLGPFGARRVCEGTYAIQLRYEPYRQPASVREDPEAPAAPIERVLEVRVGTEAGEAVEREARKKVYLDYLARFEVLEAELEVERTAARERTRYAVGAAKDFDEGAWRKWAVDWRTRLDREIVEPLRRYRDEEVLAVPILEAHQACEGLVAWHVELHRALSREVYEDFGRPVAIEDRVPEGGALVSPGTIRAHIVDHRRALARILGIEPEGDGTHEEEDQ